MNISRLRLLGASSLVVCAAAVTPLAQAFDVAVSGFIRQEMAYKLDGDENRFNRSGSTFNGKSFPVQMVRFRPFFGYYGFAA